MMISDNNLLFLMHEQLIFDPQYAIQVISDYTIQNQSNQKTLIRVDHETQV